MIIPFNIKPKSVFTPYIFAYLNRILQENCKKLFSESCFCPIFGLKIKFCVKSGLKSGIHRDKTYLHYI